MRPVTVCHAVLALGLIACSSEEGVATRSTSQGEPAVGTPTSAGEPGPAPGPERSDAAQPDASARADSAAPAAVSVRCDRGPLGGLSTDALGANGSFPVANTSLALEDTGRPTPAHATDPGAATRALPTTVWYPADNAPFGGVLSERAVAPSGPFPLVIYAHGFNLNSDAGQYLGEHLASHGFIVAAPNFPLSQQNAPGGATFDDLVNQPDDVSFVIDTLLASATLPDNLFTGAIDLARIAVVGYSLGGTTAMLVGHHPRLSDPRVRAVVSLAGIHAMFSEQFFRFRPLPSLVMHGDLDAIVPYAPNARAALTAGAPNVHLASISEGTHVGFATLPLEPVVVGVGGLIAPAGSNANNVDGIGCGTVESLIPRDNAYLDAVGGVPEGLVECAPLDPCRLDLLSLPARSAPEQRAPTKQAVLAFLRAYLDPDASVRAAHCTFLEDTLQQNAGITVE